MEEAYTEKDLIIEYLQPHQDRMFEGRLTRFISPLVAALTHARTMTGRNVETGTVEDPNKTSSWPGAMVYMTCLDHIGGLFCKKSSNDFCDCLKSFNLLNLSEPKIQALYALRNSFMHDFGLFNINVNNSSLNHSFAVTIDEDKDIVILPERQWTGYLKDSGWSYKTCINLRKFGDLVENIVKKVTEMANDRELKIYDRKEYKGIDKINIKHQYPVK